MPIFLCYDPAKRTTSWTQEKHQSMISEFTKRRIKYFSVSSPDELSAHLKMHPNEPSSLVLFPSGESERRYLFARYANFDVHRIIFSHHDASLAESNFSSIMSDFHGDMQTAISHLRSRGAKRIALLGVNLGGYHDKLRAETFKHFSGEEDPIIFYTSGKIYPCLHTLLTCKERIDAIICVNDFFAFALMRALHTFDKDWNQKLLLFSFSDTILSGLCAPSLTSLSLNYIDGGREVVTIHNAIQKNPKMAYMHIVMKSALSARETTNALSPCGITFSHFEQMPEEKMKEIIAPQRKCMALEKLLRLSDETDLAIMHGLITQTTLTEIASRLYLTRDAIKYRVRKFKEMLKCESTKDLAAILRLWIDPVKLEEMIIHMKKA